MAQVLRALMYQNPLSTFLDTWKNFYHIIYTLYVFFYFISSFFCLIVYRELEETNQFEWMDMNTDEDEHSIEMHLPYIAKVMEEYVLHVFLARICFEIVNVVLFLIFTNCYILLPSKLK